jgi:hypothetical protein
MKTKLNREESDAVTLLSIISALGAALLVFLWHVEYFHALSIVFVCSFTGYSFRRNSEMLLRFKEIAAIWVGGALMYLTATWIWK